MSMQTAISALAPSGRPSWARRSRACSSVMESGSASVPATAAMASSRAVDGISSLRAQRRQAACCLGRSVCEKNWAKLR